MKGIETKEFTVMKHRPSATILSAAAGLVLLWHLGGNGAQPELGNGSHTDITEEGLHRVHPSIMEAAWVRPELDLSRYARILLAPTVVQFREVDERVDGFSRNKSAVTEFPVDDEKQDWLRGVWRRAVDAEFARRQSPEAYNWAGADVLVVQGLLVDLVSHVPPDTAVSNFTWIRDPWIANVVLELRDGTTGELLARTIDRRYGEGLMDMGTVWMLTESLLERWAHVLSDRLDQLSDLAGASDRRRTPSWAR